MNSTDPQLFNQVWDSLRIVLTAIVVLAPFIIVFLLIRIQRVKKRLMNQHLTNQKLLDKRVELYEQMGPRLSDLLCFYCYTGNWKELSPMDIMGIKRELDKHVSSKTALFSDELIAGYNGLMQVCFVSFTGWEHEEKIKSLYKLRQEQQPNWDETWLPYFDTNNVVDGVTVKERYDELMSCFKQELSHI
jgi:hypothetical protein